MTLEEITELARDYARAVERLAELSEEIREQQRHAVRQRLRGLKARAAEASAARAVLHDAIDNSRERFASPRTRATDGVKYGLRKQPGRVEVSDEARSIARIRERLPDWADTLIRTTERLQRAPLRHLDSRGLASIGIRIEAVDDEVVIAAAGNRSRPAGRGAPGRRGGRLGWAASTPRRASLRGSRGCSGCCATAGPTPRAS